jgi:hypothetical protein
MPVKPFNASAIGLFEISKIKSFELLASVASTLYKIMKIYSNYRNVFRFSLADLVCLHRSNKLINFKLYLPHFMQCNLATKLNKSNHALT